jgi:inorganic pyrophosphatase
MRLDRIPPRVDRKQTIRIVVETPRGSRTKYSYDPELDGIVLKKTLPEGMVFPYDFGFIPCTEGEDGDPLDVLILMDVSTCPACIIQCRIIGLMQAEQAEKNQHPVRNDRFIAVECDSLLYQEIEDVGDLPPRFTRQLEEFFVAYNKLGGKRFKPLGTVGAKAAWKKLKSAWKE